MLDMKLRDGINVPAQGRLTEKNSASKRSEHQQSTLLEHEPQTFGEKLLHGGFLLRRQHPQTPRDLGIEVASDMLALALGEGGGARCLGRIRRRRLCTVASLQACRSARLHTFNSARIEDFDKPDHARTRYARQGENGRNGGPKRSAVKRIRAPATSA